MSDARPNRSPVWRPYCQMKTALPPIQIVGTAGPHLLTADGRRLLDGLASWWSVCHGYNHPHIVERVGQQLMRMPHVMLGGLMHEPAVQLAERLSRWLPGDLDHVFFADSGSVAVEVAMKMAIGYWRRHGQPRRTRFLAFENAYHGDTSGAMSLCDPVDGMHDRCTGVFQPQIHSPLPIDEASTKTFLQVLNRHRSELAGVFIEPLIQGAGGMKFHDAQTVRIVQEACHESDVLLIADEIATGFARTGALFAIQDVGIVPDIVCLGKALTAGTMTMAVAVARHHVFDAFWSDDSRDALMHGPTFMANPLACAAALASLDLFEREPRLQQVRDIESTFQRELRSCRDEDGILDVRCRGAVAVIELESAASPQAVRRTIDEFGVWLRPIGNCVYATPPLIVREHEIVQIAAAMKAIARSESGRRTAADLRKSLPKLA